MDNVNYKKIIHHEKLTPLQLCLVLLLAVVAAHGAAFMNTQFCPDEYFRLLINEYIVEAGRLPIGDESEIQIANWGFSYAYRPYLTSIIGAAFMKVAHLFNLPEPCIMLSARMSSVLSVTFLCFFSFRLGNELFKSKISATIYGIVICFLPQTIFLGMYLNNDVYSMCCVSMIVYYLVCGEKYNWDFFDCVMLAISYALAILSYYSIYGWILFSVITFLYLNIINKKMDKNNKVFRITMVIIVVMTLAGWFFIRNAFIHNGDFLGLKTESESVALFEKQTGIHPPFNSPKERGQTFIEFWEEGNHYWLRRSIQSMIGVFGKMEYILPDSVYICYYACIVVLLIIFLLEVLRKKPNGVFGIALLLAATSSGLTFMLSVLQSYFRDFQPQGRYFITCIFFIALCIAYDIDSFEMTNVSESVISPPSFLKKFVSGFGVAFAWGYMCLFIDVYCLHLLPLILQAYRTRDGVIFP